MNTQTRNTYVHLHTEPYRTVSYRSGMTVYEESFVGGAWIASGWNGAGYPLGCIGLPEPTRLNPGKFAMPQAFQVEVDGQFLGSHWEWIGMEQTEEAKGLHVVIRLRHLVRPVSVSVHTLLDGTPILTRWVEVTNSSDRTAALSAMAPISGALQSTKRWKSHLNDRSALYSLGYMADPHWGNEGDFHWHELPNAGYRVSGRFRRDRHRHPMFLLRNEATGEHFICQFGWSGGYSFEFELDADQGGTDQEAHLSYRVALDAPAPLRTLAPGETVISPEVHIGMLFGGLDDAVNAMHDHLRKTVFRPQARGRGNWVEAGIGPELEMTEELILRLVDDAASLGVEVFFIDAGWYTPPKKENEWWVRAGDWHVDRERFKQGIQTVRDKVKGKGMLFGMWMDAERIGSMSEVAKLHPEWIAVTYNGEKGRANMLNLANPEAAAWMESEIARVIEENQLDMYRLDYNVGHNDSLSYSIRDGYVENEYWRYYEALYGIYDRLRARFPHVIFETCAGGGGRTDVGMVSRFNHTWVTDWQVAPRSFNITNGMTMALPPEYVDRLLAGQGGHLTGSIGFQARLLLFVRPTVSVFYPFGAAANPEQMSFVRHTLDIYKNFVRSFMPEGRIYHHTPVFEGLEPKGRGVLELASNCKGKGILGVFQLSCPGESETTVRLRGADPSKRYRITWDNSGATAIVDGLKLVQEGLSFRLEGALTSELVIYEALLDNER